MSSSVNEMDPVVATDVSVTDDSITVALSDGRLVAAPISWYPRLADGSPKERSDWELIGEGEGIHWPRLDEDVRVKALLAGKPSKESKISLAKWQETRHTDT